MIFFRRKIIKELEELSLQSNNSDNSDNTLITNSENNYTTIITNLIKNYFVCRGKNIRAVDKMNLKLEGNEKFGLLGYNGSGKTTTFKSITNEIFFDEGEIELFKKKISKDFNEIRRNIGYCPQENIFYDELTVKRMLKIYQRLTGINLNIEELCEKLV